MKEIEKTCVMYQAFDGKEFTTQNECESYEESVASNIKVNLQNFDIEFPMQDTWSSCRAYKVNSENEFNMLKTYILYNYPDTEEDYLDYEGNGWYVIQSGDSSYADLYKLSDIVNGWANTLKKIAEKTIDF